MDPPSVSARQRSVPGLSGAWQWQRGVPAHSRGAGQWHPVSPQQWAGRPLPALAPLLLPQPGHAAHSPGGLSLVMPPRHPLSSVQVPAPAGSAPVVASAARRGTNVAVSKRTRFALQVPT